MLLVNLLCAWHVGASGTCDIHILTPPQTERGTAPTTHTSTTPLSIEALLPDPHVPASSHYRSPGDPAFERSRRFIILDTPGHGKLRNFATSTLADPKNVRGIIFFVDAAAIDEEAGLNEAAEYLHDVLLSLQKRYTNAKTSKGPKEIPVLIAANKMDLFTALPATSVKTKLEKAISQVRNNRGKALRDANALNGDEELDEEKEWLGEGGEGSFEFDQMREIGTTVDVVGGNVSKGKDVGDVAGWWSWIGEHL
jgi:signal recognition particle receptor subunit beta